MSRSVILSNSNKKFIIDNEDYPLIFGHRWSLHGKGYVQASVDGKHIHLSYYLLNIKPRKGFFIDHRDRNKLNYQKENLRICTESQSNANRKKMGENGSSRYKGVSFEKCVNKWRANIIVNKKKTTLGYFTDEVAAAKAYDRAARFHFGEFAVLNFISEVK